jgi:hypothetical protein
VCFQCSHPPPSLPLRLSLVRFWGVVAFVSFSPSHSVTRSTGKLDSDPAGCWLSPTNPPVHAATQPSPLVGVFGRPNICESARRSDLAFSAFESAVGSQTVKHRDGGELSLLVFFFVFRFFIFYFLFFFFYSWEKKTHTNQIEHRLQRHLQCRCCCHHIHRHLRCCCCCCWHCHHRCCCWHCHHRWYRCRYIL